MRTKDFTRRALRPRHRSCVRALAEALFAHDEDEPGIPASRLDPFVDDVDDFIAHASIVLRVALLFMLDAIRFLPLFLVARLGTFEDLSVRDRTRMLLKMEASRFVPMSLAFAAFKTLLTLTFFEDEAELRAAGYPGPSRERYKKLLPVAAVEVRSP